MNTKLRLPCELWKSPEEVAATPLAERTELEQNLLCAYNSGNLVWEPEHSVFGTSYKCYENTKGYKHPFTKDGDRKAKPRNSFVNERAKSLG